MKMNVVFSQTVRPKTFAHGFLFLNGTIMDPNIMYGANSNIFKAGAAVAAAALASQLI